MAQDDETSVDQFIVYGGYGEVMHRLQTLELSLWMIQTRSIKSGTSFDQAMAKVEKWDATTLGQMIRGMRTQSHWPDELLDELLKAVEIRDYLAHHFLREYFMTTPSEENHEQAAQELADLSVWLEQLIGDLDDHTRPLGVAGFEQLDEETAREIESLRPVEWLGMPTRLDGD